MRTTCIILCFACLTIFMSWCCGCTEACTRIFQSITYTVVAYCGYFSYTTPTCRRLIFSYLFFWRKVLYSMWAHCFKLMVIHFFKLICQAFLLCFLPFRSKCSLILSAFFQCMTHSQNALLSIQNWFWINSNFDWLTYL